MKNTMKKIIEMSAAYAAIDSKAYDAGYKTQVTEDGKIVFTSESTESYYKLPEIDCKTLHKVNNATDDEYIAFEANVTFPSFNTAEAIYHDDMLCVIHRWERVAEMISVLQKSLIIVADYDN